MLAAVSAQLEKNMLLRAAGHSLAATLLLGISFGAPPALAGSHDPQNAAVRQPAALYHNYCSVCHGDKGDGRSHARGSLKSQPRDFTTPDAATQLSRDRMIRSVKEGVPGTAMIGWKVQLNQKEIEAVVDYVRDTFMLPTHAADASRGRAVYSKNCSVCHGEKGDGRSRAQYSLRPSPRDFTAPGALTELSRQRMITSVTFGRPETAMAGFKTQLGTQDIEAVVDYIRAGFMGAPPASGISGIQHGRRPAAPDMAAATPSPPKAALEKARPAIYLSLPMPHQLKGDATKGGNFYMANCATCHGVNGDGRGPRASLLNPKPRNFLDAASRQEFNRPVLFNVISAGKRGTEMPAWDKVLNRQEIADVAEFVFQRFLQLNDMKAMREKGAQQ